MTHDQRPQYRNRCFPTLINVSIRLWSKAKNDLQIVTNRSNVFPATLLVGLSVNAVALAFATAAVPVLVY